MTPIESLLSRLGETEQRYKNRQASRSTTVRSLERGDFLGANQDDAMRERLAHLGVSPALTEGIGTRSFSTPDRPAQDDVRAIINTLAMERIIGSSDLMPISFLTIGRLRARSVGRVHIKDAAGHRLGYGTGFMVSPRLLLTNNHVLESAGDAAHCAVEFDFEADLAGATRQTVLFPLDPGAFFLTDQRLDFSLVAVAPAFGREPREWGWLALPVQGGLIVKGEYASIVQHPNGEAKQLALRENRVIDLLDDFAHYHTDTAPGSSGSPVFNDQWELVALHHSGVPDRFPNGDIKSVDNKKWEQGMGDHRIKWVANEGVFGRSIATFVKNATTLSEEQKRLRDALFDGPSPLSEASTPVTPARSPDSVPPPEVTHSVWSQNDAPQPSGPAGVAVSWTIPLRFSLSLGVPQPDVTPGPLLTVASPQVPPSAATAPTAPDSELALALKAVEAARGRVYFDGERDTADRDRYYAGLKSEGISRDDFYRQLNDLLATSHTETPAYQPSRRLYPWVDLHPDLKLRSVYSGKPFEPEQLIREDFRIGQERVMLLQEMMQRELSPTPEILAERRALLEAQNPFNCEHVVPQSWFAKQEPMRGDLHHLFACESGCNSFRGNTPYFDFSEFEEAERTACGRRTGNRFEPVAGKGAVARGMLYFLLRYPGKVDDSAEFPRDRLSILLKWHGDNPVTDYERHRNQAIFETQHNRNPLIDHPDWAAKIDFTMGLKRSGQP